MTRSRFFVVEFSLRSCQPSGLFRSIYRFSTTFALLCWEFNIHHYLYTISTYNLMTQELESWVKIRRIVRNTFSVRRDLYVKTVHGLREKTSNWNWSRLTAIHGQNTGLIVYNLLAFPSKLVLNEGPALCIWPFLAVKHANRSLAKFSFERDN